jgi:hypothetical protein
MNYANQYQISYKGVNKKVSPQGSDNFLMINWDVLTQAYAKLTTPSERFLYLYLLKFRGLEAQNKTLQLSPTDFESVFGVSLRSYKLARASLEEKNFLRKTSGNCFIFDPLPE